MTDLKSAISALKINKINCQKSDIENDRFDETFRFIEIHSQ